MALEIERRFLLKNNSWEKFITKKTYIEQGYFTTKPDDWVLRIRSENKKFKLTLKKLIKNFTNHEFEYEIPTIDGEIIISNLSNKIFKERFYLRINQKDWIVDIFQGTNYPLRIAEIELTKEDEKIEIPNFISKEITGIKKFSNVKLAETPLSSWRKEELKKYFNN